MGSCAGTGGPSSSSYYNLKRMGTIKSSAAVLSGCLIIDSHVGLTEVEHRTGQTEYFIGISATLKML